MSTRFLIVLICLPIWLFLILAFRKQRQWLLYYLFGAFGFTLMAVLTAEYFGLDQILVNVASYHTYLIAKYLGINLELLSNARLIIQSVGGESVILKLGIECSAILEFSILIGLIFFYPVFRPSQKVLKIFFGLLITYVINIIRMLIIVYITYQYGSDMIYIAHALIARFFFFCAVIILYWYLISRPSVQATGIGLRQKKLVDEVTAEGKEIKPAHSYFQIMVITALVALISASLIFSSQWKQTSTAGTPPSERPLIYPDETEVEESSQEVSGASTTEINFLKLDYNRSSQQFEKIISGNYELISIVVTGPKDITYLLMINNQVIKEGIIALDSLGTEINLPKMKFEKGDKVSVQIKTLERQTQYFINLKLQPIGVNNE